MRERQVPEEAAGSRLDRFLAAIDEVGSRAAAERLIDAGAVKVDGAAARKSLKLAEGQTVSFPEPEPAVSDLEPVELEIPVVYRDDRLLVVDKPAGLLVHPVPGFGGPTLVHG